MNHSVLCVGELLLGPTSRHNLQYLTLYDAVQNTTRASAPSATDCELQVAKAAKPGSAWADAALAGLPPEDEAVQMAELAATAGRSLEVQRTAQLSHLRKLSDCLLSLMLSLTFGTERRCGTVQGCGVHQDICLLLCCTQLRQQSCGSAGCYAIQLWGRSLLETEEASGWLHRVHCCS